MRSFVVTEFVSDRGDHPVNEDLVGCTGPFAWVMDGASAIGSEPWIDDTSDAHWLVAQYDQAFREFADADAGVSCEGLVRRAIEAVRARVDVTKVEHLMPNLSLGIMKLEDYGVSYFGLGDTTICLLDTAGNLLTPLDGTVSHYDMSASREIQELVLAGSSFAAARDHVYERMLEDRQRYMNQPDGYWTISVSLDAVEHGVTGFTAIDLDQAFLMTDGFRRYVETYQLGSDLRDSMRKWIRSGLDTAVTKIRDVEEGDPEMRRFPRVSPRDDATCVRLSIGGESGS